MARNQYYVSPETSKGAVIAYGVFDNINGLESEHERFLITGGRTKEEAHRLAKIACDKLNYPNGK